MNTNEDINILNDHKVLNCPTDSVNQMRFYPDPNQNILIAGSFDSKVTAWNINYNLLGPTNSYQGNQQSFQNVNIGSNPAYREDYQSPVLSVSWQNASQSYFAGTADGSVFMSDIGMNRKTLIGKHQAGCKEVLWAPSLGVLFSGGWDNMLYIWDVRNQGNPAMQYRLPERVVSMSISGNLLVVALQQRSLCYFNLQNIRSRGQLLPELTFNSHLKFQTRRVCCFPDGKGYAICSIEGRVAIKYINLTGAPPEVNKDTGVAGTKDDYAFRCHRTTTTPNDVYPVNDIAFNPKYGTFCTAGGDGCFILWDKDNKSKLKQSKNENGIPLTACDISQNGMLLAYAQGYDWSRGINGDPKVQPSIRVHFLQEKEREKKK
ncbi:MAG: hypothetical protein MJ252_18160 [archaeon]|nr:hypothetical protein [archaeon]